MALCACALETNRYRIKARVEEFVFILQEDLSIMKILILLSSLFALIHAVPWHRDSYRNEYSHYEAQSSSPSSTFQQVMRAQNICMSAVQSRHYFHLCKNGKDNPFL